MLQIGSLHAIDSNRDNNLGDNNLVFFFLAIERDHKFSSIPDSVQVIIYNAKIKNKKKIIMIRIEYLHRYQLALTPLPVNHKLLCSCTSCTCNLMALTCLMIPSTLNILLAYFVFSSRPTLQHQSLDRIDNFFTDCFEKNSEHLLVEFERGDTFRCNAS